MVKTTTEHGMTGEVMVGKSIPRSMEAIGYRKGMYSRKQASLVYL